MKRIFYLLFFIFIFYTTTINASTILHIKIDGAISPATATFLKDAFVKSKKTNANILLIELDTPGGLATSMREMIQDILNSPIPIVMYVSPKGARAASAGTFLMYAAHIAAMSPGTNIGAATPVNLIQLPKPNDKQNENQKKEENTKNKPSLKELQKNKMSALEKKVLNDSVAYIKSIAQLRNRNIPWAIEAVEEGKSISARAAKEKNVIDIISNNVNSLLEDIHGKEVLIDDKKIIIDSKNATVIFFEPSWKTKFLMTISNPNIAYMFLLLAMYGIIFEMMNPGSIFPGVIGLTSALIAMYALNILPFNYVGLLLIFAGIFFMIAEVFVSGFGIMGIMGVVAFAFGSVLLFDEETLGIGLSFPLIISLCLISLGFFIYVLGFIMKIKNRDLTTGSSSLIGVTGTIIDIRNDVYKVMILGEIWNAKSPKTLKVDDEIIVEKVHGLTLDIRSTE